MPSFNYRALDASGGPVEGTTDAESARAVVERLRAEGLNVTSVLPAHPEPRRHPRKPKLSWEDLVLFNEQLAAITRAGLPMAQSLAAVASDLDNPRVKTAFTSLHQQMDAGHGLAEALEMQAGALPPTYCAMVRAGEAAGNLTPLLESLTFYSRRMAELRSALWEAMAYPFTLAAAMCVFLLIFCGKVVPSFAGVFSDFGARLPAPTQLLIDVSRPVSHNLMAFGLFLAGAYVALLWRVRRTIAATQGSLLGDWLRSKIPLLGGLYRKASLARFCRTLGMLLDAHAPILDALSLAGGSAGDAVLSRVVEKAAKKVAAGLSLSEALTESGWFPSSFCWFLRNAEQHGDIASTLLHMADTYEHGVDNARRWLSVVVGPAMVIAVAMLVGFFVVALYLPIFSLGDAIN